MTINFCGRCGVEIVKQRCPICGLTVLEMRKTLERDQQELRTLQSEIEITLNMTDELLKAYHAPYN